MTLTGTLYGAGTGPKGEGGKKLPLAGTLHRVYSLIHFKVKFEATAINRPLAVIPEPEATRDFSDEEPALVDPERSLRPMDALKAGAVEAVVEAAHSFLDAFS